MSFWRPSPDEERWLEVADRLGAVVPAAVVARRADGWRCTGPLARIALFVLGLVAAVLVFGILGFGDEGTLLAAGLIATVAAEWLTFSKRLHASGVEEGLCVAGFLMIGGWIVTLFEPLQGVIEARFAMLVLIAAGGAAGLRLLNPFVTTCAVLALLNWVDSSAAAHTIDQSAGAGMAAFVFGCGLAALALGLGAREYRRPSHDRMLDWLVVTLPVAAYAQQAALGAYALLSGPQVGLPAPVGGAGRIGTVAILLALGAALLVTGLRRRRHAPLLGFLGCVACLAVELRLATTLSTEVWLILCGIGALAAGFAIDRYLREPRRGITSRALEGREGPLDLLQTAGAALLAGRATPATAEAATAPHEGRFGGGGASGNY